MSLKANDIYNEYWSELEQEAHSIIKKALNSEKLLVEIKGWEELPFEIKDKALKDFENYVRCNCGCKEYYLIRRMVSRWDDKKKAFTLYFYKHINHDQESFENLSNF